MLLGCMFHSDESQLHHMYLYRASEVIGKGSYGVVCSALDTRTGEKVAIKKINDIFEHVSDATRLLREIKLLRLPRHPDIVEIKHILLPSSGREFKDIYVAFELMESDLHQILDHRSSSFTNGRETTFFFSDEDDWNGRKEAAEHLNAGSFRQFSSWVKLQETKRLLYVFMKTGYRRR
ncbi:Mitogen-activated protein kinase 15 [Platanthera zijinensis]|uniref:Mitogen-activated protein kinase 15 n=1 Tax=Platanthera zijinensis TaxID=2320716 RepID=A0AAP0BS92_9ASPA